MAISITYGRMDLRDNPTLRIISIIVLAFFLWTFGGLFDIAYAIKSSDQQSAHRRRQRDRKRNSRKQLKKLSRQ